jgi:hypothetical protein
MTDAAGAREWVRRLRRADLAPVLVAAAAAPATAAIHDATDETAPLVLCVLVLVAGAVFFVGVEQGRRRDERVLALDDDAVRERPGTRRELLARGDRHAVLEVAGRRAGPRADVGGRPRSRPV